MTEFGRVEKEREKAVRRHSESERRAQVDTGGYAFQPGAKDLLHYLDMIHHCILTQLLLCFDRLTIPINLGLLPKPAADRGRQLLWFASICRIAD